MYLTFGTTPPQIIEPPASETKKTPVEGSPCKKIISRGCGMQYDSSDERCNPNGVIKGGYCRPKPIEGAPCGYVSRNKQLLTGKRVNGVCAPKLSSFTTQRPIPQVAPMHHRLSKTHLVMGAILVLAFGIMFGSSLNSTQ
jgi:hypothetical protein